LLGLGEERSRAMVAAKTATPPISIRDYEAAEHDLGRDEDRRGFRVHAAVYVAVNLLLFGISLALIAWSDDSFAGSSSRW
jgi:hypothetical protein